MWGLKRKKNFNRVKTVVLFMVLLIFLLPYDLVSAAEENNYYTILLKETDNYNDIVRLAEENHIEVVYSIEELGLLQVKGNEEKIKVWGENSLIDAYNPSLRTFGSKMNVEKEMDTTLLGSLWDKQWDMHGITNNGESYKIYSGSKNVTVGIIDWGFLPIPSKRYIKEYLSKLYWFKRYFFLISLR
ncbi:hypothetical protein [Bacillus cereus]|uniref:hypothetical protein n=1 Tax=Bacillus cereus TaxID=1396 RepID=UPI000BED536C|nr:hypothetical protein [Bacillus cereus]PEF65626.1 hypothetical protein CON35_13935 [Bacillus cereus]